ncbi:dTDP-4-dehydrorhamnose reductase [Candidatus Methylopumilus turicensis]|uniref:dTDP-4-dehydrorhamnose reductase n=1 Tax=Candidatus Methylopumilus turicensis TaxID=1581680 RepID=A0A0B7IUR7_9PROT|nr:dTDP-4-dehydrorhamnose reductase [Candidatus Methylopumilus turicensis]CEN56010.1 dTDP-4-dehydrorhamnose reductase subunit, NAD(P)-binding, of dTDP-L-rhamnose synthase [Candidatus Methylopumilus turicensis]
MKILVTGKNGQVGFELMRSLATLGTVIGVDLKECDLSDSAAIDKLLEKVKPDLIVNPAAYTAVDKAESEPVIAHAINAKAPEILAKFASRRNIPIIHYSTDYVFDGLKEGTYTETDKINPKSVYGKSKALGEAAVRNNAPKHIILRTSWVFGSHGVNFLKTMLKLSQERDRLSIVSDQIGSPTSAALLADVTAIIAKQLFEPGACQKYGTYHLVTEGETSWHGYAQMVVARANKLGVNTKISSNAIQSIRTADYPLPAPRLANSRLDTTKIKTTFGVLLPTWQDEVIKVLEYIESHAERLN